MAFFDLQMMLDKLADSPQVKQAMIQFIEVREGIINAAAHFNSRFDALESLMKDSNAKQDKILFLLEHPSDVAPAGDDGLMKLLAESGQEMQIQTHEPMQHETELVTHIGD